MKKVIALSLTITLIVPSLFFFAPPRAQALFGVGDIVFDPSVYVQTALSAIKDTLIEAHTATSAVADYALYINAYVLQPLAFILSGNLMQKITAGVIAFVTGQANGTGQPQFVQNLSGHLQTVGDTQALAFFAQFGRNSNSPFAASITSSLRTYYLQQTSAAGFWAANRNTLPQFSQNPNAFLAGNWSQGGIGAWFALTTQTQNNPYTLYQASQSQLASVVGSAQAARLAQLNWGQGFLSWCGPAVSATPGAVTASAGDVVGSAGTIGTAPGDACTQSDGTPRLIKTPGSTIKATLDKVLGGAQDKLAGMGSLANEVNGILGNIGTVFQTVNLAQQILQGPNSGGLLGAGTSVSNSQDFLGVTTGTVYQGAAGQAFSGADMLVRVDKYVQAWSIINAAAQAAQTAVNDLLNSCSSQSTDAQTAITYIQTIMGRANTAFSTAAAARAMVTKIQNESSSSNTPGSSYFSDIQILQTMPPTEIDASNAQQETLVSGGATANPSGSLSGIMGGSLVDQMNLIITNATALKSSCGGGGGGGSQQ